MREIYMDAFSEVDAILNIMPSNLFNKIPLKFRKMISKYKNNSYNPRIEEPVENFELKDETKIILSLIYRDFLCSDEEKERLKARDAQKLKKEEEHLREKYNTDKLFKNRKIREYENISEENCNLTVIKEDKWYTKLFKKLQKIFRKGKNMLQINNKKTILKFYRDYSIDDEKTGQLIIYDRTNMEYNIVKNMVLNIEGNNCNTKITINNITDKFVELTIEDDNIFEYERYTNGNVVNAKIEIGKKYEYFSPSAYHLIIQIM